VLVIADPIIDSLRWRIAEAASARLMASAGQLEFYAAAGFLVTYAPEQNAILRRAAVFVDQILRGAQPADLPIERPTKYIFTINASTARNLGLTVSPAVLSVADEVIE
jgi:putative tryptophan/tyrosine transport system substrate-binding protein